MSDIVDTNHSSPVTEPALKPCPFCGSKSVTISYFNQPATKLAASCQSCLAVGPVVDRYADPFAPWNTRTRPARCAWPTGTGNTPQDVQLASLVTRPDGGEVS